jgi:hypothetical protein
MTACNIWPRWLYTALCFLRDHHRWQVVETHHDLVTPRQRREVWRYCKTCGVIDGCAQKVRAET